MRVVISATLAFLGTAGTALAGETPSPRNSPRPSLQASTTRESFAERKAVRGIALESPEASESPELRAMRRFEEQAFPRPGAFPPGPEPDDVPRPLPPGLEGRWGGTGDIPRELRSPERGAAGVAAKPGKEWLSQLTLPDLPVRWEPQVVRYLEFFKDDPKGRGIMTSWLRRMGRYRALIERKLDEQGLPRDLIYLAMVESGFDPGATSQKSAGGIWQFIPGAARAYGLEVSRWVDARRDPERATEAAARLLKDLYVRFGSWPLAFAVVQRRLRRRPAFHRPLQHQRLLGAGPPRGRPALGDDALRAEDPRGRHRRPQPQGLRLRRAHAGSAVGLRPRRGRRPACRSLSWPARRVPARTSSRT